MKISATTQASPQHHNSRIVALVAAGVFASLGLTAKADVEWQGPTASYTNAADWVGGVVPGATNNADNSNGILNILQLNPGDPDWTIGDITAAGMTGSTGAIEQNGPTLNVNGWFHVGAGTNAVGIYTLDAGTINIPNGALFLGEGPGSTSTLNFNAGTINKGNNNGNPFFMGVGNWNGNQARTSTVNQVTGILNCSSEIWIGQAALGTGIYNLHGGTINQSNWFVVGRGGSTGTLNMDGGTINQFTGDTPAFIVCDTGGAGSVGTLNFSGGTINSPAAEFWIANGGGSTATNNMSGTAALNVNNWIAVGRGGDGYLNISGGSINKTGPGNITLAGINTTTTGTVTQTGGSITNTTSQTWIGESGTGVWNMNGGTAILGQVNVCQTGSATGTLNLNGGLMQATGVNSSTIGFSTLNFNGGTLQASANNVNFVSGMIQALVSSAGAIIDSQGFNITIPQTLADNGGGTLTKNGTGTLTLTGGNSYTGNTTVNGGTLIIGTGSFASGGYTVADTGGFGVIVQSAGGQTANAGLSLGGATGGALSFDMGAFGNPLSSQAPVLVNTGGTFTVNGTISVSVADALPQVGEFPLVQYPSGGLAGSGHFVLASLPVGVTATIVTNVGNNSIDLNITGVNQPLWDGLVGGIWDINGTTNWINIGTGQPTFYTDGAPVLFNDTATGTTTVSLTANVSPTSVTFNNTNLPYSIVGGGKIMGTTGITKTGTNTLSILNTGGNTYTGKTVISGGTLIVSNLANGGSPSAIGASSASPTNLVINNATFSYIGNSVAINRGFQAATAIIDTESNLSFGGVGTTTSGTLFKQGPATLTYAGVGTNVLSPANIGGAFQGQNGTLVLDGTAGAQTNSVIGEMWIASITNFAANIIVSNTSLGISSWFALGRGNGPAGFSSSATFNNSLVNISYVNTGSGGAGNGGGISLGYNNGLPNSAFQTLNVLGTTILTNLGGNFNISESAGSFAVFNLSNSATITSVFARALIGNSNAKGVLNLNSTGTSTMCTTFGQIFLGGFGGSGDAGSGALNLTAGKLNFGNGSGVYIHLGDNGGTSATSYGSFNMSGGTLNETSGDGIRVGFGGNGSLVQSGGTMLMGRFLSIGGNVASGNGVATFTGGTASIYNTGFRVLVPDVGNATGVFNMGTEAGGTSIFTNLFNSGGASFIMENSAGGNGTLNLNSGVIQLGGSVHRNNSTGGSAVANFNGGTLQAGANNITLLDTSMSSLNMFKGGLTLDTLGNTVTASGNLLTTFGNGIYPAGGKITVPSAGGAGYIGAPLVTVTGGSGSGAMAIATLSNGIVTNIVMTCPGQNYVAGDVVTFGFLGGGSTTAATAFAYTLQAGDVAANAGGGLTKIGSGLLQFTGGGTYTGATAVNAGTLLASGTVFSPVTVSANATLGVGATPTTIGTLTVNNSVTFAANSTNFMKVNKASSTQDLITSTSQINYGGTLVVSNTAGTLTGGESFKLFNASLYNGSFSAIVPAIPGVGLTWVTNQLSVSGTLLVSGGVNTNRPSITNMVSGGNLNISWATDHLGWRLQGQTNAVGTGITTNWVTVPNSTNVTSVAIPVNQGNGSVFFRLVYP